MEIIGKDGSRREVSDALYSQAMQGRAYLAETLGKEQADAIFAQLGVDSEKDLTEAGQKDIRRENREKSEPVVDFEAVVSGNPEDAVESAAERYESARREAEQDEEIPNIFAEYEIGEDGKVRTHKEAAAYKRSKPAKSSGALRGLAASGAGFAAYKFSKWAPVQGMMLNDKGEPVPEGPLETEPNTKYRMADPNNPEEADYVRVTEDGKTLYRVQALRDMTLADGTVVKAGEWGGWIESEDNLSFTDNSWVKDEAVACEAARVSDGALLKDEATAAGWSRVTDGATVEGEAAVDDRAIVKEEATVSGETVVTGFGTVSDGAVVDGVSTVCGTAEVANKEATDIEVGNPADAEARLAEEQQSLEAGPGARPDDALYGSTDGLDMDAYEHKPWTGAAEPEPDVGTEPAAAPEADAPVKDGDGPSGPDGAAGDEEPSKQARGSEFTFEEWKQEEECSSLKF